MQPAPLNRQTKPIVMGDTNVVVFLFATDTKYFGV